MKVRYKKTGAEAAASQFNIHALGEVLTGDDSAFVSELDIWVNGEWKDMRHAFRDKDIIVDNYNTCFFEPRTKEERERGYSL